jgi:hypothetical protein
MKTIVLGAGIVGVTSAYQLARTGHEVTVIDRQPGPALETSFANAGGAKGEVSLRRAPVVDARQRSIMAALSGFGTLIVAFEEPAKRDIDYALSMLMHDARRRVADEKNKITSEAIKRGAFPGSRVIVTIADAADKIHKESLKQAKQTLLAFIQHMDKSPEEIIDWVRPHLENLSNVVLGGIVPTDPGVTAQYRLVFQQRLDGMLREIEIGYLGDAGFVSPRALER